MRNRSGQFCKGIIPQNKIVIPKEQLRTLYKGYGATIIARQLGVSKQTVLRNLHEYCIPLRKSGSPIKLPDYWKFAIKVPKSGTVWNRGQTKQTDKRIRAISESLKGEKNQRWKPEIHTGEWVYCACGCGKKIAKFDRRGRERLWAVGHSPYGRFTKGHIPANKDTLYGKETKLLLKIKQSQKYREWRRCVLGRDGYTCQNCHKKIRDCKAHHIIPMKIIYTNFLLDNNNKSRGRLYEASKKYKPFWNTHNGVTLCGKCHYNVHFNKRGKSYGGKKRKTA